MKKIFICIPTLASAGAERFVTELACNLNKAEFEPIIVVTNKLNESTSFYQKLIKENVRVLDVSNKDYFCEILNIRRILREERPSIVHTNIGSLLHMLVPVFLFGRRTRHIFTVHSMGSRIFNGFKKILVAICFYTKVVVPVAISDIVKQSVVDSYKIRGNNIELVYNGVDTSRFFPRKKEVRTEIFVITTGTLYHIKNQELLIDAFYISQKQMPNLRLILIGEGELRQYLEYKVKELGIENKVNFVGKQSNVSEFLTMADIYCCTSIVEGLPISVLEAMSCGLPVVTTPAGGIVDIVQEGVNGYIVPYNKEIIAEKIINLAQNGGLRNKMGKESRRVALKRDISNCARGYEALYTKYSFDKRQDGEY